MHQWQAKTAASPGDIFGKLDVEALREFRIRLATFDARETGAMHDKLGFRFLQVLDYSGNAVEPRWPCLDTRQGNLASMKSQNHPGA